MGSILESWSDPHTRHAMLVHLPIAMGVVGVLPLIGLACCGFRSAALKAVVIGCFVLAALGAKAAAVSGADAAARLRMEARLTPAEAAAIEVHHRRGERAWIWPLIPAALTGATFLRRRAAAGAAGAMALLAAVGVSAWFGVIAHAGGRLVYSHGLGVPPRAAAGEWAPSYADIGEGGTE